jgi:hypothetical protein
MTAPSDSSYREILLTDGQTTLVDADLFEWLNQWRWRARWNKTAHAFYAVRRETRDHKRIEVAMHREILGLAYRDPRIGDHRDPARTLDNRRDNLRITDRLGNSLNRRRRSDNTSGFKGVDWKAGKWQARITVKGERRKLGRFDRPEDAFAAYCDAAKLYHGEFARFE